MKTYIVTIKRLANVRDYPFYVEAKSFEKLEEPIREFVERFHPAMETAPITISEIPQADGSRAGQFDYGLLGEFTVMEVV